MKFRRWKAMCSECLKSESGGGIVGYARLFCYGRSAEKSTQPRQQKFRAMNEAHLARPIKGELGYALRLQLGSQMHCSIENQIWGPLGKEDVCPNFALTVTKFVFSNSGNFRAKANPPKPRSC